MGLIILDRDNEGGSAQMRRHMRQSMRDHSMRGYRSNVSMKSEEYDEAYAKGYEHGWKDCEKEM